VVRLTLPAGVQGDFVAVALPAGVAEVTERNNIAPLP
jgi:hypothetical protein